MKFDMHCHTKEGSIDGKLPLEEYIEILKAQGFQGMLITDHNSYNGYRFWKKYIKGRRHLDFVILKGIEYDTIDAGHILVIMPENVKLKILELRGMPVSLLIDIVHHNGGILGPAHPCGEKYLSITNTKRYRTDKDILGRFDFIEAFNSCESEESNQEAFALAEKYDLEPFGGSDSHRADCAGTAYTEFEDEITCESDVIASVMKGSSITCGGRYYHGTTKEKMGKAHTVLVQSFWVYNKLTGYRTHFKRKKEMVH